MSNNSKAKECGQRLRRIRMAKNMSQQELAERLFTTPQNISKYEKEGISNIDIISKISDLLGYNILRDELDEEGTIGEIGKEILSVIILHNGYIDVENLIENYMHGLDMERTTNEIFKLQRIGLCVREQFVGYAGVQNDGLFITAKGIIALNHNMFSGNEKLKEQMLHVPSFEEIVLQKGYDTYQELLHADELEQLLWKLPFGHSYRANYIKYLKDNFQKDVCYYGKDYDAMTDMFHDYEEQIGANYLSSENAYFDILQRMVLELDNATLDMVTDSIFDPYKFDVDDTEKRSIRKKLILKYSPRYEKQRKMDTVKVNSISHFFDLSDWYAEYAKECGIYKFHGEDFEDSLYEELDQTLFSPEDLALVSEYEKLLDEEATEILYEAINYDYHIARWAESRKGLLITDWFSKEEIECFINENMAPAQTEEERMIDEILMEINRKYPETLNYYVFPQEWEENGLADLVRKNCNIH